MSKRKKSFGFIIGIAVAVLLPLSFFLYYNQPMRTALKIPAFYRIDSIDSQLVDGKWRKDTVYHRTKDLKLVNQLGKEVSLNEDLKGKILLVNFFFTNCNTVCPPLTENMNRVVRGFEKKNRDIVHFVSISVDPNDSVPALRAYADKYTSHHDRWWFVTGNKDSIFDFAKNELGLVLEAETPDEFMHSQQVVLLDTFRNIRAYYDGLDPKSFSQAGNDIIMLKLEKRKKRN